MVSSYSVSFTAYKTRKIKFIRNQLSKIKHSVPTIQTKGFKMLRVAYFLFFGAAAQRRPGPLQS